MRSLSREELGFRASCIRHRQPLPYCDHCANMHVMNAWARSLSGEELAERLEILREHTRFFLHSEQRALLTVAAERARELAERQRRAFKVEIPLLPPALEARYQQWLAEREEAGRSRDAITPSLSHERETAR